MTKRALITGITGMVGSHLADYLVANTDWDVYGVVRLRSPLDNLADLAPRINAKDRVFLLYGDLLDAYSIQDAVRQAKPDYVFHLAAQSSPFTSFAAPLSTLETNVTGTASLLEAVRAQAPHALVHVCASCEVYGKVVYGAPPIKEDQPFHPSSPYAISKIGTDLLGRFYAEAYGLRVMTTRMFQHSGPRRGDSFAESSFAKQIAMIEKKQIPPVVKVGNLRSIRTYADVRDAVRAYHMLLTVNPTAGEVYNIGGTRTLAMCEVLEMLLRLSTRREIDMELDPTRFRPIDADYYVADTNKFTAHTGWKPEIPFEQTMDDLLAYWRKRVARGDVMVQR